jgi:hypothetical protein
MSSGLKEGPPLLIDLCNSLSDSEVVVLDCLESAVARGLRSFLEVGNALLEIREQGLYRAYGTFEAYCRERWGISRTRSYELMDAATVTNAIAGDPTADIMPTNEAQVRPLARLDQADQAPAWREAVETAPGGKVTGAHVAAVAEKYRPEKPAALTEEKMLLGGSFRLPVVGASKAGQGHLAYARGDRTIQLQSYDDLMVCIKAIQTDGKGRLVWFTPVGDGTYTAALPPDFRPTTVPTELLLPVVGTMTNGTSSHGHTATLLDGSERRTIELHSREDLYICAQAYNTEGRGRRVVFTPVGDGTYRANLRSKPPSGTPAAPSLDCPGQMLLVDPPEASPICQPDLAPERQHGRLTQPETDRLIRTKTLTLNEVFAVIEHLFECVDAHCTYCERPVGFGYPHTDQEDTCWYQLDLECGCFRRGCEEAP